MFSAVVIGLVGVGGLKLKSRACNQSARWLTLPSREETRKQDICQAGNVMPNAILTL